MTPTEQVNEAMMEVSKHMPMRRILVDEQPYIERYYVKTSATGEQTWLHRFLSADGDRSFHSHPWYADSVIVCGGYQEESMSHKDLTRQFARRYVPGDTNIINPTTLHMITSVDPMTWSVMQVKPNWGTWYFIDDNGKIEQMGKTHGEEWWKRYDAREINFEAY